MKQNRRTVRDPYYYWKIANMALAAAVVVLALLVLLGQLGGYFVPLTYLLGGLMCGCSGIMELSKGKKVIGYASSVLAGGLAVAMLVSIVWIWV